MHLTKDKIYTVVRKFVPLWVEIVESGLWLSLLALFNPSQQVIAFAIIIKTAIKGYYLKNVRNKNMTTIPGIPQLSEESTNNTTLSLQDRVSVISEEIVARATGAGFNTLFNKDSLSQYIMKQLTVSEEEIRQEALAKLTRLQRKALGIKR